MARTLVSVAALAFAPLLWATGAAAQVVNDDEVCPVDEPRLDATAWLRALSLDLRGAPPNAEDFARVDAAAAVDEASADAEVEAIVDEWLASPEFAARVVRHHREHLWPNLDPVDLNARTLQLDNATGIYSRGADAGRVYRGVRNVLCKNEPATFDASGAIVTTVDAATGANREGFVEVAPYWDPENPVRVCAFDAQAAAVDDDNGVACDSAAGSNSRGCGCGEGLQFCARQEELRILRRSLIEDLERRVAAVVDNDESYLELLTGRRAFVNGPIAHFFRFQRALPQSVRMNPPLIDSARLPALPFTAIDDWREVTLGAEASGVLTSPAYLLRFQSNRARANRFYNAWLCQPFQPPAAGIEIDAAAAVEPDLQERNGCKYCHAVLEPASAHWGRFGEYGANYLSPLQFPTHSAECFRCATTGAGCTDDCRRFYVTRATTEKEREGFGGLAWYQFRKPEHVQNVDDGPRRLVLSAVVDGRLPDCVARSTSQWLLGRPLAGEEQDVVDDLVVGLLADDFSYRALVKRIVLSDLYRRVR